ncbi:MAG: hypothetical protein WD942_09660 [Dehalococcoidia bacterium]
MDLLHLVDRLEELVAGAQKMPIGNRAIVDRRRMLDLIDQMRISVPHEVREAQDIVAEQDAIRREAEEEGRIIVARAEERAAELVQEHSITEGARQRAEEIALEAERRLEEQIAVVNRDIQQRVQESRRIAREQMAAADEYARELLLRLERQLQAFQSSVQAGVQQLEPPPSSGTFDGDVHPLDDEGTQGGAVAAPVYGMGDDTSYAAGGDDELEDLLRRPRGVVDEAPPGVIDDFEHDPLDDDQLLRPMPRDRD